MAFLVNEQKASTAEQRVRERDRELTVTPTPQPVSGGRFTVVGERTTPRRIILGTPRVAMRLASTPVSKGVKIGVKSPYTSHSSNGDIWDWLKGEWRGIPRWTLVTLGCLGAIVLVTW